MLVEFSCIATESPNPSSVDGSEGKNFVVSVQTPPDKVNRYAAPELLKLLEVSSHKGATTRRTLSVKEPLLHT